MSRPDVPPSFKWALVLRRRWCFWMMLTRGFFFDERSPSCVCGWHGWPAVFLEASWCRAVTSNTESCLVLMQFPPRAWRSQPTLTLALYKRWVYENISFCFSDCPNCSETQVQFLQISASMNAVTCRSVFQPSTYFWALVFWRRLGCSDLWRSWKPRGRCCRCLLVPNTLVTSWTWTLWWTLRSEFVSFCLCLRLNSPPPLLLFPPHIIQPPAGDLYGIWTTYFQHLLALFSEMFKQRFTAVILRDQRLFVVHHHKLNTWTGTLNFDLFLTFMMFQFFNTSLGYHFIINMWSVPQMLYGGLFCSSYSSTSLQVQHIQAHLHINTHWFSGGFCWSSEVFLPTTLDI